jgi:hypothetical protein
MERIGNECRILIGKSEMKIPLVRDKRSEKDSEVDSSGSSYGIVAYFRRVP